MTDQGVVQNVVHVDSTLSRTQEAVLLMLTINGSTLAWLLRTRKSGMKDSYESFAVLASLVVAHDGFLPYFVPVASGTSHLVPLLKIGVAETFYITRVPECHFPDEPTPVKMRVFGF